MKNRNLMNSYLYEAWKKAGLNDEDAKKAAIESASTDVAIGALHQAMTELRAHVDTLAASLRSDIKQSQIEMIKFMLIVSAANTAFLALLLAIASYLIQI